MKPDRPTALAIIGNCIAMTFYGLSFVWTKIAYAYCGPFTLILARLVLSAILLTLVDALFAHAPGSAESRRTPGKKDIIAIGMLSLFMPFLYFVGENLGLVQVSPGIAAAIIALIPVATPLLARVFLKEKVGILTIAGIVLSLAGVLLMIGAGLASASATIAGALLVFLAVLAAAAGAVVVRGLPSGLHPVTIVKYQNIFGALLFLPLFLIFEARGAAQIQLVPDLVWSVVALAALPSTVSYVLYNNAIRVLGPSRASVYSNAVPVIAAVFSALLLGEGFGPSKLFGMALVVGGVVLAQLRSGKRS
jgi:drug/metabolite transporter (DMT)-like permease